MIDTVHFKKWGGGRRWGKCFMYSYFDKISIGARVKTTFLEPSLFISETGNSFKRSTPAPQLLLPYQVIPKYEVKVH